MIRLSTRLRTMFLACSVAAGAGFAATAASAKDALNLTFDEGVTSWRVVLDGVMGGRSTGRVIAVEPSTLRFTGDLSLENNGGFSQIRTAVRGEQFADAEGVELRVRGDGRKYTFDIRASNVRMMAGGFQRDFQTVDGEWMTIQLPFEDFRLYSFGRLVRGAPDLDPRRIESVGVTLADKKTGSFTLDIDSIRTYGGTTSGGGTDLFAAAEANGLTTLLELIRLAEIELPSDGPLTILAPTNDAFAKLDQDTVAYLTSEEGRSLLQTILAHHVIRGAVDSQAVLNSRFATTLADQRLRIGAGGQINDAQLEQVDLAFDGGLVHVIDTVLIPATDSIEDLGRSSKQLSTLMAAIDTAGLAGQLSNENGPWTVFAPVDSAFQEIPAEALNDLLKTENRQQLIAVLGLHVVPGRIYANELLANRSAATYFGTPVDFSLSDGGLRVNGANIITADIEAANGVVHLIDSVLLPAAGEEVADASPRSIDREVLRILEDTVAIGAPLYNDGNEAACAALYELSVDSIISLTGDALDGTTRDRLMRALEEAERHQSATNKAWALRRGMDDVYVRLARRVESNAVASSR